MTKPSLPSVPAIQTSTAVLLIVLLIAAAFGRTLGAEFVYWDDDINILQNPKLRGIDWDSIRWMFTDVGQAMRYKPLNWLTWAVIYEIQGLSPFGYHLVNLLFHMANSVTLFFLVRKILALGLPSLPNSQGQINTVVTCSVLLWALHPLRVEPVAWITGLPYCQSLCFMLIAWILYLNSRQEAEPSRRRFSFWAAVGVYGLVALTYPIVIPFPFLIFATDIWPLRRLQMVPGWWRDRAVLVIFAEKLPFLVLAGVSLLPTIWARFANVTIYNPAATLEDFTLLERTMQGFYCWFYYAWRHFWPFELTPYPTDLLDFKPTSWLSAVSAGAVILVSILLWRMRRTWPTAWVAWVGHLLVLVPTLGLTERTHFPNDRYTYVAAVVWVPLAALILLRLLQGRLAQIIFPAMMVTGLLFSAGAWHQTGMWRNSYTLLTGMLAGLEQSKHRYGVEFRLGVFYYDNNLSEKAREIFSAMLQAGRQVDPSIHAWVAEFLMARIDFPTALPHLQAALDARPNVAAWRANLGIAHAALGNFSEAESELQQSLQSAPNQPEAARLLEEVRRARRLPASSLPK